MKKLFSMILALAMLLSVSCATLAAGDDLAAAPEVKSANVFVTSSSAGKPVLEQEPVEVTDRDKDGVISIYDAILTAHIMYAIKGADDFAVRESEYGPTIEKLWGVENGGSYMYYLNDGFVTGLRTEVKDGDRINVYSFRDLETWSDVYTFFDKSETMVGLGKTLELRLMGYDYSLDPNGGASPIAGAYITLNGEKTDHVTDADGRVSLSFEEMGRYVISAGSDSATLVPPVTVVNVTFADVDAGDWYAAAVKRVYDRGLMVGASGAEFAPKSNMTIAQFWTIIYRIGVDKGYFGDGIQTEGENWQESAKVLNERSELGFPDIDKKMTRGEMAAMCEFAFSQESYSFAAEKSFTDQAGSQYEKAIALIHDAGIIDGYEDGSFRPDNYITRAEVAQVVVRLENVLKRSVN